jgi:hypothetical protein
MESGEELIRHPCTSVKELPHFIGETNRMDPSWELFFEYKRWGMPYVDYKFSLMECTALPCMLQIKTASV